MKGRWLFQAGTRSLHRKHLSPPYAPRCLTLTTKQLLPFLHVVGYFYLCVPGFGLLTKFLYKLRERDSTELLDPKHFPHPFFQKLKEASLLLETFKITMHAPLILYSCHDHQGLVSSSSLSHSSPSLSCCPLGQREIHPTVCAI